MKEVHVDWEQPDGQENWNEDDQEDYWEEHDPEDYEYYEAEEHHLPEEPIETKSEEQPAVNPSVLKAIISQMEIIANEVDAEQDVRPSLKALGIDTISADKLAVSRQVGVMIDGGASHRVYYSASIPEGALEKDVELAHGTKNGYFSSMKA